jgi:hypothetical protein
MLFFFKVSLGFSGSSSFSFDSTWILAADLSNLSFSSSIFFILISFSISFSSIKLRITQVASSLFFILSSSLTFLTSINYFYFFLIINFKFKPKKFLFSTQAKIEDHILFLTTGLFWFESTFPSFLFLYK